jgi:hypothetical protein
MDEGSYFLISVPYPLTGLLIHSMPESAAVWTAAFYSPKSFYIVNLFPSRSKFGPGSGKSHPMHFLSRPRVGLKSDSFCVMNFMTNSPVYPSVQKEILFQREIPPLGLAGKCYTDQFSFLSPTPFSFIFPHIYHQNRKSSKLTFSPLMEFYILFFRPSSLFFTLIHFSPHILTFYKYPVNALLKEKNSLNTDFHPKQPKKTHFRIPS